MISVCYHWRYSDFKWNTGNWTWSECQLVNDCIKWGEANQIWKLASWKWSDCSGSFVPPIPVPIIEVINQPGVDATTLIQPWLIEPWNPYRAGEPKKKKLIRLICKTKNIEYDEKREVKDFDISIDDIKFIIKSVAGIDVSTKVENHAI